MNQVNNIDVVNCMMPEQVLAFLEHEKRTNPQEKVDEQLKQQRYLSRNENGELTPYCKSWGHYIFVNFIAETIPYWLSQAALSGQEISFPFEIGVPDQILWERLKEDCQAWLNKYSPDIEFEMEIKLPEYTQHEESSIYKPFQGCYRISVQKKVKEQENQGRLR